MSRWLPFMRYFNPILLLALLLALLALSGCHREAPLDAFGKVPAFALIDENEKPFTDAAMKGSVWAAAFVFTRCPTACPKVTTAMKGIQADARARHIPLRLVSFSIDPENDTPEVLRKYIAHFGVDPSTWTFVTGDPTAIRTTAERGFKIAADGTADPAKADFGITHGTQLVLVDSAGEIRGYYASGEPEALTKLVTDAGRLAAL
jgi:protein SCO1/2